MKVLFGITLLLTAAVFGLGQGKKVENPGGVGNAEHGKYIVHECGTVCPMPHSPR